LFVRPVGFDYRSKLTNARWRKSWDWALWAGAIVPSLVFGVAFGNLLLGVPFRFDDTLRLSYHGTFWQLLSPFGLVAGVVSLAMLAAHGGSWLMMRTDGVLAERARRAVLGFSLLYLVAFIGAGAWLATGSMSGLVLDSGLDLGAAINPLVKSVQAGNPGWMDNYRLYPYTAAAPLLGVLGAFTALLAATLSRGGLSFLGTALAIVGTLCTAGFALFPFVMPSSLDPASSLTVWDAVSSRTTLSIMTVAAGIFVPIILAYTSWCYWKLWGKVTPAHIDQNPHSLY
jgi:cytochrome d ubiquinol oxidase subunit II